MSSGLVYVFTGEGKGKTSAALGVAVRSALIGEEVCWIAWYKQNTWDIAEKQIVDKFANFEMHFKGLGFLIAQPELVKGQVKFASVGKNTKVIDTASPQEHKNSAIEALKIASEKIMSGKYFLVVLDEILNAVSEGLLEEQKVIELLSKRGDTHVVVTGRGATEGLIKASDLVTECRKIKHPYDEGRLAVKGLDF